MNPIRRPEPQRQYNNVPETAMRPDPLLVYRLKMRPPRLRELHTLG